MTSDLSNCPVRVGPGFVDSALTDDKDNSSKTGNSAITTVRENELLPKMKWKGMKLESINIASSVKHLDELRIFVEKENLTLLELMRHDLIIRLMILILK